MSPGITAGGTSRALQPGRSGWPDGRCGPEGCQDRPARREVRGWHPTISSKTGPPTGAEAGGR